MNVIIASIFRDSSSYLPRYFNQVATLALELERRGDALSIVAAEGDSADDTEEALRSSLRRFNSIFKMRRFLKAEHGGQRYGSVDVDERWRNISFVCNALLAQIEEMPDHQVVLYVESDLIWDSETMLKLIDGLERQHTDAIVPLCIHQPTGLFYDTWGYRADAIRFTQHKPYHAMLAHDDGRTLYHIDSAGSCIAMTYDVAKLARFDPPELGIVGFGNDMRQRGFRMMLDPTVSVFHP